MHVTAEFPEYLSFASLRNTSTAEPVFSLCHAVIVYLFVAFLLSGPDPSVFNRLIRPEYRVIIAGNYRVVLTAFNSFLLATTILLQQ